MSQRRRPLQLLAPARDTATAREAILHGADAVYIGALSHGARQKAANGIDDIRQLCDFAAPYGVKIYVTVNTIIYDEELEDVRRMVYDLFAAGVDAIIVQDMALTQMHLPAIALHASTQCDTRDAVKAQFLASAGFSQIVIARESSLDDIREITSALPETAEIEAFVHGALCVSYSGDCRAGQILTGRSANRGNCPQICRLGYTLIDGKGKELPSRHYLSLRDLNRIADLKAMADAGVSSFKIEGRLKDISYVKEVTAAYRQALDNIINANPEQYCRASRGFTQVSFTPNLNKAFNRGFTDYFLHGKAGKMASLCSPKALGEPIGNVIAAKGRKIVVKLKNVGLNNGDGISYIAQDNSTQGFRINRVENNILHLTEPIDIIPGTTLYRSYDKSREDLLSRDTATRLIPIDVTLRQTGSTVVMSAYVDEIGEVAVTEQFEPQTAGSNPTARRREVISKLGGTVFTIREYTDRMPSLFLPASFVAELRRRLVEVCLHTLRANNRSEYRKPYAIGTAAPTIYKTDITYRDNVANRLAEKFYHDCGAQTIQRAVETTSTHKCVESGDNSQLILMESRYCLRRELGACLREGGNEQLPEPLTLRATGFACPLKFDCARCRMQLLFPTKQVD